MTHWTTFTMTSLGGIREVIDSRDEGSPGLNDGMAVGMLLVLSFMLSRWWYILHYHRSTLLLPLRGEVVAVSGGVEGRSEVIYCIGESILIYCR